MAIKAVLWGADMILGFVRGIKEKIGKIGDAVKGVANKIKNFLHFSRPDMGPLRDYETWMPDMMRGLARGMNKSSYLLENATDNVASRIADRFSFNSLLGNTNNALKALNYGVNNSLNPMINPNANNLRNQIITNQSGNQVNDNNQGNFTAIINNNSKYTSPAENVRLLRQEYELYRLKHGGNR